MNSNDTIAVQTLESLLALDDGKLRNTLGIAIEYADHPSILNAPSMPAGGRLLRMLQLALDEAKSL